MDDQPGHGPEEKSADQMITDAPSARARTLREEILGSALALEEVAYILSLDRTTVAKYLREGTIAGFQIGREWLIPEEELRNYVRRISQGTRLPPSMAGSGAQTEAPTLRGLIDRMREDLPLVGTRRKRPEPTTGHSGRFEKFTSRARHVLTLAQEEAVSFNHNYIGTEHLLLGLLREEEGVAAKVLVGLGVELERVRSGIEFIIGRGGKAVEGQVGLTPRAKKVMELAVDEARRLGHHYVGTEHLLLGLVREGDGIAAGVLESLGITLANVRTGVVAALNQNAPTPTEADRDEPRPAPLDATDLGESDDLGDQFAGAERPVPAEAANLVDNEQEARTCAACGARSPLYFQYCFNCGKALGEA
jgi:excisionase family DNA binding protein